MIVVEPMPVHANAVLTRGNFRHSDDAVIPHFRKITATTNSVDNSIELALTENGIRYHLIGDAAAPRQAPYAFHDGRKIGLAL